MTRKVAQVACAAALMIVSGAALADVSDVVLTIHALSGRAEGSLEITADQGTWDGDNFFWSTDAAIPIMSGSEVLGTFGPGHLEVYADPMVALGFSLYSGDTATTFTINSAYLSFPTIEPAAARASAAFTVEDFSGAGAALDYTIRAYLDDGLTFCEASQSIIVTPPETLAVGSCNHPEGGGYEPIPQASGMGMEFRGDVSAHSFVSGSMEFEVIPEPASLLLFTVGLGLVRRR